MKKSTLKYKLMRGMLKTFARLPLGALYILSDIACFVLYKVLKYRVDVVRRNLNRAFPEKSEAQLLKIEREFYRHLCDIFVETAKLAHISDSEMARRVHVEGAALVNDAIDRGRSVVLMLGHYGNWEWITYAARSFRPEATMCEIYHPLRDKVMDRIMLELRSRFGTENIPILTGAKEHPVSPDLLINIDLENFFPTITFERVRGLYQSFGYSGYIASLLAMLCTYCERMPLEVKGEMKYIKTSDRILPQGSPASPMITNVICRNMDKRMQGLCQKLGLTYTRYADDMSFSYVGDTENLAVGSFLHSVHQIIEAEGFHMKKEKTHILRKNSRQYITGIVINEEIGVPKKWVKVLKASIHNAQKLYESGGSVPAHTIYEISGKVAWLKSVNAQRYQKVIQQGTELLKKLN